jgi:biopolymer transport protein ExbB/TolQ
MTEQLQLAVYTITTWLLWPVVTLLLFALAYVLFLLGSLCAEAFQRRGQARSMLDPTDAPESMRRRAGIMEWNRQRKVDGQASPWLLLDRTEARLAGRIDRARTWARLGPAMGLAGTLIPLGPALLALAQHDLQTLSDRLILAFGTTVMGLVAGSLAWLVAITLDRWYRLDLAEIRHALEAKETKPEGAKHDA